MPVSSSQVSAEEKTMRKKPDINPEYAREGPDTSLAAEEAVLNHGNKNNPCVGFYC